MPLVASPSPLPPEAAVLLCCTRVVLNPHQTTQLKDWVHAGLDWTRLLRAARRNGVMPLLAQQLLKTCPEQLPASIHRQLQRFSRKNLEWNLFLTGELLTLLRQLQQRGIPALPLKGPVLAVLAYGDLAARQFRDLDLLLQPHDVATVTQLLVAQGYQLLDHVPAPQVQTFLRANYHWRLRHPSRRTIIELHWGITHRSFSLSLEPQQLWQACETVMLTSSPVQSMSMENLLLFLCIHGTRHSWDRLGWVCDIAELLRSQPQLDLDRLRRRAAQLGAERMLVLGVLLAHDLLDAPLPATLWQRGAADAATQALARQVRHNLLDEKGAVAKDFSIFWFCVRARERIGDKIRYSLRLALTPALPDWQWVALPTALNFLYFPLRPLRLALKGVQHLVGAGQP